MTQRHDARSLSTSAEDPRVRRTRRALQAALGELIEEGAPVTMSAIAKRADLSRQVLHSHYASVSELAVEVLVCRILGGTGHQIPSDIRSAVPTLVDAVRRDGLAPFLQFIQDDRDAFLSLRAIAHGQSTAVLAQVFAARFLDEHPSDARREGALFAAGGMTALVEHWVRDEAPSSAVERASRLQQYARSVLSATVDSTVCSAR